MSCKVASFPPPRVDAPWLLGVDAGTTNTKVVALTVPTPDTRMTFMLTRPTPDTVPALIDLVHDMIRATIAHAGSLPRAIGVASMAESGALLDARMRPVTPLIRWNQAPASPRPPDPQTCLEHFLLTGVRLSAKTPLVFLDALAERNTALRHEARHWASTSDLIVLSLTGRLLTDATLAGRTGLYLLPDDDAAPEPLPAAFAATGIPGLVPTPVDHRCYPCVLPEAAGTPVTVCGHDHPVAAWAAGMRRSSLTVCSVGTSEAVLTISEHPVERGRAYAEGVSLVRPVSGSGTGLLAGSPQCGALLALWSELHPAEHLPRQWSDVPAATWEPPLPPYPQGRQAPAPDPRPVCRNLLGHGPAEIDGLNVLDSLAVHSAWLQLTVAALAGTTPSRLTLIGHGVRRNPLEAALRAHHGRVPTSVVTDDEPVAAGAALLAGVRSQVVSADATLGTRPVDRLPEHLRPPRGRLAALITQATTSRTAVSTAPHRKDTR